MISAQNLSANLYLLFIDFLLGRFQDIGPVDGGKPEPLEH